MIIKRIIIKNFRSYYGENVFGFSNGLTLIWETMEMVRQHSSRLCNGCLIPLLKITA